MKQKKSQMEIMGLAIVVVLILIATIFVVRFLVLKKPTDYRKGFVSSELASNMLSAFLKTSARECMQLTMTELLQDCAQEKGITCSNGQDSCRFAETAAKKIFESTFDKWNTKYEFLAYTSINAPLIKLGSPCRAEKNMKIYPIPIKSATMYAKLEVCG